MADILIVKGKKGSGMGLCATVMAHSMIKFFEKSKSKKWLT